MYTPCLASLDSGLHVALPRRHRNFECGVSTQAALQCSLSLLVDSGSNRLHCDSFVAFNKLATLKGLALLTRSIRASWQASCLIYCCYRCQSSVPGCCCAFSSTTPAPNGQYLRSDGGQRHFRKFWTDCPTMSTPLSWLRRDIKRRVVRYNSMSPESNQW